MMGAWGEGSFENDTAMDWADSVTSPADVSKPFDRLKKESDAHPDGGDMYIEADFASELIAAAETVAMMMGRRIPDFPEELEQAVGGEQDVPKLLFHQARNALIAVLRNSELAELWEEAAEESGENEWTAEIGELTRRLDPDIKFVPLRPSEKEEVTKYNGLEDSPIRCGFCNEPVDQNKLFMFRVSDMNDAINMHQSFWIHLTCLNKRLHHKHALHNMKIDPGDADFDMSQL